MFLVSTIFEYTFVAIGNTFLSVVVLNFASNFISGSRKLKFAIRFCPIITAGSGKHRRSRPLVLITVLIVNETSKNSNKY